MKILVINAGSSSLKYQLINMYTKEVEGIREAGLFEVEATVVSPQGARVKM